MKELAGVSSLVCLMASLAASAAPGPGGERGPPPPRTDIVDRNGVILATTGSAASLFANPRHITDVRGTADQLAKLIPGANRKWLLSRLSSPSQFVWVARWVPENVARSVVSSHLAGIGLKRQDIRRYPFGRLTAHVIGFTDLDTNRGRAGVEAFVDNSPTTARGPLRLTIDVRIQQVISEELRAAITACHARGAAALVLDARSGQVLALQSLPDFDPNDHSTILPDGDRNKLISNVYEMGGIFEVFSTALALDQNKATADTLFDVTQPLRVGSTTLRDDEQSARPLSLMDIFSRSSVIGAARIAQISAPMQMRSFLQRLGLLNVMPIETGDTIPHPLYTKSAWDSLTRTTVGYGYGVAVTPLQAAVAASAIINDGLLQPPTLVLRDEAATAGRRVVSKQTSAAMRRLLRDAVLHGTGSRADVPGYAIGGKTGTSVQVFGGRYAADDRLSWFFGGFPMDEPLRYTVLVMLDRPHGTVASRGMATAQYNAAPAVGRIVTRIGPLLDVGARGARARGTGRGMDLS